MASGVVCLVLLVIMVPIILLLPVLPAKFISYLINNCELWILVPGLHERYASLLGKAGFVFTYLFVLFWEFWTYYILVSIAMAMGG